MNLRGFWKVLSLSVVLSVTIFLTWSTVSAAPSAPDIEVTEGYRVDIEAGETAVYQHVISNTGDVAGAITVVPDIPLGWGVKYATRDYPEGTTLWQPFTMPVGITASLGVWLTPPASASSGLYTSTITVTLLTSPTYSVAVQELTYIRERYIYLPLIMRRYRPFVNGSFESSLSGWSIQQKPLPVSIVSNATEPSGGSVILPSNGGNFALLGNPTYACNSVPLGFAALEQSFVVPLQANSLTFDYVIWSQDASLDQNYDRFEVYVWKMGENMPTKPYLHDGNQETAGGGCSKWWRVPETGWKSGFIDLTPYRGEMITVSFRNYSRYDGWYNTYTYLDNVQVQ